MKVTVDFSDFYLDEEADLMPALKAEIIRSCTHAIKEQHKELIAQKVDAEVKRIVSAGMETLIEQTITEIMETQEVKSRYGKEKVPLRAWVIETFENTDFVRELESKIREVGKKYGEEVKSRYDVAFASSLVQRMHQNQLLKDDVAKLLIDQPNS